MKQLYDDVSLRTSILTTRAYSTSFSLGILLLSPEVRKPVYAIYGFVRLADEIVDSFDGYDKRTLLKDFKNETFDAINKGISLNPILNSFQHVVRKYTIDLTLISTFFESMEMDLEKTIYTPEDFKQYILGSAEVVGLMCLQVFTGGNSHYYNELKASAMRLGAAFQKVNFLRDLKDDYQLLGRAYFPNVDMEDFSYSSKRQIESEIEEDFKVALEGIKKLPATSKGGVYLAYVYYRSLFTKIKKLKPEKVLSQRIRINNGKKLGLMVNSFLECKLNLL